MIFFAFNISFYFQWLKWLATLLCRVSVKFSPAVTICESVLVFNSSINFDFFQLRTFYTNNQKKKIYFCKVPNFLLSSSKSNKVLSKRLAKFEMKVAENVARDQIMKK
jgi:hypothetical protein